MFHPYPFFDDAAVNRPAKGGQHAVEIDALQQAEPIRVDGPVPVLLGRERLPLAVGCDEPLRERRQQRQPPDMRVQEWNVEYWVRERLSRMRRVPMSMRWDGGDRRLRTLPRL